MLDATSLANLVATLPPELHIDLRLDGEQASGSAGCNTYGARFQAIGGSISFGPITATQMACDKPTMDAEAAYLRALEGSTGYQATSSTTMHLTGGPVDLSFVAASASASPSALTSPTQ